MSRARAVLTSPLTWQWYHGLWALAWAGLFIPAMTVWAESIPLLMFISMQTALGGSLAGFVASISARKADPKDPM